MAHTLVMPKLGLTMTEGTVGQWLKREGDPVVEGEDLYEVETDKLTNTITANVSGILLKILAEDGQTVPCLAPVAVIGAAGEAVPEPAVPAAAVPAAAVPAAAVSGTASAPKASPGSPAPAPAASVGGRVIASPAAKKLAKEKGIELALVHGTGPGGRVTLEDVAAFQPAPVAVVTETEPAPRSSGLARKVADELGIDLAEVPSEGRVKAADVLAYATEPLAAADTVVPMSPMRKVIARRMKESQQVSAPVAYDVSVDLTALRAVRQGLADAGHKVSYTDLLVWVVARLLPEHPLLNCSIEGEALRHHDAVNLGVAVAVPDGLLVPVIANAHTKGLDAISAEVRALAEQARAGQLSLDALSGGTFTITNLGMFGIESFTPIINQPEVAILGVNAITDTPVAENGQVVIRPLLRLSLVADHRAVDGAVAATFLAALKTRLEQPALLWL